MSGFAHPRHRLTDCIWVAIWVALSSSWVWCNLAKACGGTDILRSTRSPTLESSAPNLLRNRYILDENNKAGQGVQSTTTEKNQGILAEIRHVASDRCNKYPPKAPSMHPKPKMTMRTCSLPLEVCAPLPAVQIVTYRNSGLCKLARIS